VNSGFMIAHCTAAALVSENKVLVHPASCDSISTSAAQEDHVSMGGWAARKALNIVTNVEKVLAIELIAAAQVSSSSSNNYVYFSIFFICFSVLCLLFVVFFEFYINFILCYCYSCCYCAIVCFYF
jgi:hypothetical protein